MKRLDFLKTGLLAGAALGLSRTSAKAADPAAIAPPKAPAPAAPKPASNQRPKPDRVLTDIADYVGGYDGSSDEAYATAQLCIQDAIGCGIAALSFPACTKLLGPLVAGTVVPHGAKVPGTSFQLDPVEGAFQIGLLNRWLDYNDAWLAAEWGHPSDNLGGILATADWLSRTAAAAGKPPLLMRDVSTAMIKAYEVQGVISLETSLNNVGMDHVVLVKVASVAVVARLLGLNRDQIISALSHAWADGGPLRAYRQSPNVGSRKSWAAGDATARAVRLALIARTGEMGIPSVLTAKEWGFYDAIFRGKRFTINRPYGSYVMENVLFKISYPCAFHIQTAVECAIKLREQMQRPLDDVQRITIRCHRLTMRELVKTGPLNNPADRDHCIQYAVAIGLLKGNLAAEDYDDAAARDPRIDALRDKMVCIEEPRFTQDYYDPEKRSNANAILVEFKDGAKLPEMVVEFPLGHRRRRAEGLPLLAEKFRQNLARHFSAEQQEKILSLHRDRKTFEATPVHQYVDAYAG